MLGQERAGTSRTGMKETCTAQTFISGETGLGKTLGAVMSSQRQDGTSRTGMDETGIGWSNLTCP